MTEHEPNTDPELDEAVRAFLEQARERGLTGGARDLPEPASLEQAAEERCGKKRPQDFPGYAVIREVDRGGQGIVYEAVQISTDRSVAIKAMRPEAFQRPRVRERFEREVHILGHIDHDGVCPVIDFIDDSAQPFVVMPFIEGDTLAARVTEALKHKKAGATVREGWSVMTDLSPVSDALSSSSAFRSAVGYGIQTPPRGQVRGDIRSILRLMEKVACAVHAVHEHGVIHRDLKPSNIMIRRDGRPVVVDFGLALDLAESNSVRLTRDGDQVGTPAYMAPEQVRGKNGSVTPRTDVYALGVILYELLTFQRPYRGQSPAEVYMQTLAGAATRPRRLNPEIPRDLEAVCLKAMEVEPVLRYESALAFAEDLRRVRVLEPTMAKPLSGTTRLIRRMRRNPWTTAGFAAAVLVAALGLGWNMRQVAAFDAGMEGVKAAYRVREAAARGDAPAPADLAILTDSMPHEGTRESFLANPLSADALDSYVDGIRRIYRSSGETGESLRLHAPRAGVTERQPSLEFSVPAGISPDGIFVRLSSLEEEVPLQDLVELGSGVVRVQLEEGVLLEIGEEYVWTVKVGGADARAVFRIVDGAEAERVLAELRPSGDADFDHIVRGAALLSLDLAARARVELVAISSDAPPALQRHRALLSARASALLGESRAVEGHKAEYLSYGLTAKPGS